MTGVLGTLRRPSILLLVLALPLVRALAVVRDPRWFPTGDLAQAELHARAVPAHLPLLGAAGRFGTIFEQGSHPGPAGAMVLSVPYRLFGSSGWALMVATVVVHLAAIALALVVVRRVGDVRAMAVLAVVVAVMMRSFGAGWFVEPWNPWFGVFVLLLVIVSAWGVWSGDHVLIPVFVAAGSYCAQVHIAYAPVVGGLLIALVARAVLQRRRGTGPSRRSVVVGALVGVVMWLPTLVDELTREPGNLTVLWRHFVNPPDDPAGWRATLSTFVNEINLFGSWSAGAVSAPSTPPDLWSWIGFVGLLALASGSAAIAFRRDDAPAVAAWQTTAVVTGLTLVTVTRIYGPVYDYLVRWMSTVAAVIVMLVLWTLWRAVAERRPEISPAVAGVLGVVALAALATASITSVDRPLDRDSTTLSALAPDARAATDNDTRYLMRFHDPVSLGALGIGMLVDLEREGRSIGADQWLRANVLPHRTMSEADADAIVWVVTGETSIEATRALPGAILVAETDPRTPAEVEMSEALRSDIETSLRNLGREDLVVRLDEQYGVSQVIAEPGLGDDLVDDLEEYRALRLPTAVVLVPVEVPA